MGADADARIWAAIGASGVGKGLWIKQHLRRERPARLVVWDYKREYGDFARLAPTLAGVRAGMLGAGADGPLRVAYCPHGVGDKATRREFEGLCELVYAWGSCTFLAEELSNVTMPGWAPASWRKMSTSGRHESVHIIGTTQSPALIDKAFLANCTLIHCGALREHKHRAAVARSMDIDAARIAGLARFEWIEKDFDSNEVTEGRVRLPTRRTPTPTRTSATPSDS